MNLPIIGAHISAAGGVSHTIERAKMIGATAVQAFGSSPRQWSVRPIAKEEAEKFRVAHKAANFGPTFFHAPYLINLGSPDRVLREKSERLLRDNLELAENLGIEGVIFHIGSRRELAKEKSLVFVVAAIKRIFSAVLGKSKLLIENSAGGGNTIGSSLEEIAEVIHAVTSERIGMCYDSAHGFESGIIERYTPQSVEELFARIEKTIGKGRLRAVHLNDSKTPCRSNADRHENIGEGYIGADGIRAFVQNKNFQKIPWYLEVPGFDGGGPDKKNIEIIRKMIR